MIFRRIFGSGFWLWYRRELFVLGSLVMTFFLEPNLYGIQNVSTSRLKKTVLLDDGTYNIYCASQQSTVFFNRYGRTDIVEALMDNQNVKIINLRNSQGKTALHFACAEGHDSTTEALLRFGATIDR